MNNYKIRNIRVDRFGNNETVFLKDGKAYRFTHVGRIWQRQASNGNKWCATDSVVDAKADGLLRYGGFKSRTTKPLTLAEGEIYLPLEQTGKALLLETLPIVGNNPVSV